MKNTMMVMLRRPSSNLIKAFAFPSRTLTTNTPPKDTLFNRLVAIKNHKATILPVLDGWIHDQRDIDQKELQKIIRQFRKFARYKQALEISKWMINSKYLDESPRHLAVHLDLISKVHGIKEAEEYFNEIPESSRAFHVYGALLHCYVDAKLVEKAETIMQKIKQFKSNTPLAYNGMLKLYSQTEDYKKFDSLVEEMDNEHVLCDIITLTIRLNAYAAYSDISKMENLLRDMEAGQIVRMNWHAYATAASGYLKAGFKEKSLEMLQKAEHLVLESGKFSYRFLMSIYASMGSKDDVYRMWRLIESCGKIQNLDYLCMMSSLEKMDDLDGMEKMYDYWELKRKSIDFRCPNFLVTAYCKRGLLEKGEMVIERLVETGHEPYDSTWSRMAIGYWKYNRMDKLVETIKKVILSSQSFWKPNLPILNSCFVYLEEKGEVEKLEEIKRLLEKKGHSYADICEKIAKYHESKSKKAESLVHIQGEEMDEDEDGRASKFGADMNEV